MARPRIWVSSVTIGLALAWQGSPLHAQRILPETDKTPSQLTQSEAEEAAADDNLEQEADLDETKVIQVYSVDTAPDDDQSSQEDFGIGRSRLGGRSIAPEAPVSEVIKERFSNGKIKVERRVTQDADGNYVNNGGWKMWDDHGNPIAQGAFDFGNRTGIWTRWYRNAQEIELFSKMPYQQFSAPFISQATFKRDQLDGVWTIFDSKTRKVSQIRLADGKRNGAATWWYATGRKMREAEYREGELDGPFLEWSPEGKLVAKDTYQAGRKLASKLTNHPGSGKKSEGTYLFAKEVEQTGDDWWNCKLAVFTKAGPEERHGVWRSWYTNGQIQLEGTYEHDVQVGSFSWWHSNGQKAQEGRFDHGKQDGIWTWWHPNGQKSIRGEYVHGNPTGRWTWWKEDGHVVQSADLSHSDGIAIENMPGSPDTSLTPHTSMPMLDRPAKR